ncbi:MAG: MBL fold metallo-hydrolase [Clostridia bacterium]|nr:MBL fold metallo-hydrolase [Clostridia bacterium]
MKNKFLSFLCALLALVTLLTACGKKDETPADTTPADTTGVVEDNSLLALVKNKEFKVNIIYPEEATSGESTAAISIYNLLKNTYGGMPTLKDDFIIPGQNHDEAAVEILVGNTNYAESQEALSTMQYSEWAVKVVGNKILVLARLDESIKEAGRALRDYLISKKTEDSLYVERSLAYSGNVDSLSYFNTVPFAVGGRSPIIYDTGNGCKMLQYEKMPADVFAGYDALVTATGYEKISSYDFLTDKNKYAHYVNGDTILNVFYSTHDKTARVFVETKDMTSVVSATAGQYSTVSGYVPKLFQLGCSDPDATGDTMVNGMSYMFYLADGSFVVFDGGADDSNANSKKYNRQNARRIVEIVKEYTPAGKKPTIAAWVLTHAHSDHMGAFTAFDKLGFHDQVKVESIIMNLPSPDMLVDMSDDSSEHFETNITGYTARAEKYIENGTTMYKAHPGQIYRVRNVDLQILFTPEQRADEVMGSFNNSSIVTRVVVNDAARTQELDTVMITGDMYGEVATEMAKLYGEAMHSDFVQVPHHGWFKNDTGVLWQMTRPNYVLWPVAESRIVDTWNDTNYTQWLQQNLLNNDMNSSKIFWSKYDTVVIDLPFTGTNFTRMKNINYTNS